MSLRISNISLQMSVLAHILGSHVVVTSRLSKYYNGYVRDGVTSRSSRLTFTMGPVSPSIHIHCEITTARNRALIPLLLRKRIIVTSQAPSTVASTSSAMSNTSSRNTETYAHSSTSRGHSSQDLEDSFKGKPPLPYTVGATFTAYRHEPDTPFGHGYDTPRPPFKTGNFWLPQIEYCLSQPPLPGRTLKESRTLTITSLIRTGYTYSAQVVVVNKAMVAKIYDPLYDNGFDCYDNKRDAVVLADGDYSREAAAYETLQQSAEARTCTPKYHGSWTIQVQTTIGDKTHVRHVRLVLIEHVNGTVMSSIMPQLLPAATRSRIMQRVLEAETVVFNAGVHHRDMSPRNVVLVSSSNLYTDSDLRVVIIDFNVSNVLDLGARCSGDLDHAIRETWPGRMVGPITRFWDALLEFEVRGWVADDADAVNEWLWECFRDREEYVPVAREEGSKNGRPRLVKVEEVVGCRDQDCEQEEFVFRGRGV